MDATWISPADTAKLVRKALKRGFPGTKFGVRTSVYSGGASIHVSWTDGPATALVDGIVAAFCGGRFDGSIDLASSVRSWLMPDGSATLASDDGTLGSRGSRSASRHWMPHPEARLVRFGADHVFTSRSYSDAFTARVLAKMARDGFRWEAVGAITRGWPEGAECARITNLGFTTMLSDELHRVRSRYMVAAG